MIAGRDTVIISMVECYAMTDLWGFDADCCNADVHCVPPMHESRRLPAIEEGGFGAHRP